jgi:uncharacterized protein
MELPETAAMADGSYGARRAVGAFLLARRNMGEEQRRRAMHVPRDAMLLRVFIGEDERDHGRPRYEAIVLKARELRLAGATVLRGPMGFGHSSRLHTAKILRLSEDLPVVIEIVDSEQKITEFLPVLDGMMGSGLVTLEKVQVLVYGETKLTGLRA